MKTCFKCDRELPLDAFYKHPMMADGRLGKCKECTKADVRANYKAKRPYYIAYERARANLPHRVDQRRRYARTPAARESAIFRKRRYIASNPEKRAAHVQLGNALRDGKLVRQPCESCGAERAHAHHDDYSKPLDVRWLCPPCHAAHHRALRRAAEMAGDMMQAA